MKNTVGVGHRTGPLLPVTAGGFAVIVAGALAAPGCSSSGSGAGSTPSLATDAHVVCVTPSTSPQDISLPSTGGFSGTLSFDAFPGGATGGCDEVKIATGASVETLHTASVSPGAVRLLATASAPTPILTISVGEGLDGNPLFGSEAIVTGMVLKTSPDLNFADGTYYMTISKTSGTTTTRVDAVILTATNGVLRIAPLTIPNGTSGTSQFPVVILANTTATLSVYARGVIPPASADTSSTDSTPPSVNVSDAGLPPLPTDLPPHGTPMAGARGFPPPDSGATIGYSSANWASGCSGNPGCNLIHPIISGGGVVTPIDAVAGMSGVVTYETNIAYMGLVSATIDCPQDWGVAAGLDGSGTISIPESDPFTGTCTITYSTIASGQNGTGYEIVFGLRGLDIGAH